LCIADSSVIELKTKKVESSIFAIPPPPFVCHPAQRLRIVPGVAGALLFK
jgi:hypothetical protein